MKPLAILTIAALTVLGCDGTPTGPAPWGMPRDASRVFLTRAAADSACKVDRRAWLYVVGEGWVQPFYCVTVPLVPVYP